MSDALARQEAVFTDTLDTAIRGPRRNGLFAVWLVLRLCGDLLPPTPVREAGHRRRLGALTIRLRSLSLPMPLRRALTGAMQQVADGSPEAVAIALRQLVAPVRETLGRTCGDAVGGAANIAAQGVHKTASS